VTRFNAGQSIFASWRLESFPIGRQAFFAFRDGHADISKCRARCGIATGLRAYGSAAFVPISRKSPGSPSGMDGIRVRAWSGDDTPRLHPANAGRLRQPVHVVKAMVRPECTRAGRVIRTEGPATFTSLRRPETRHSQITRPSRTLASPDGRARERAKRTGISSVRLQVGTPVTFHYLMAGLRRRSVNWRAGLRELGVG